MKKYIIFATMIVGLSAMIYGGAAFAEINKIKYLIIFMIGAIIEIPIIWANMERNK